MRALPAAWHRLRLVELESLLVHAQAFRGDAKHHHGATYHPYCAQANLDQNVPV